MSTWLRMASMPRAMAQWQSCRARALTDVDGQVGLELAPQRDALEQRAALVDPRQAEAQRRVHVEVAVDERRRDQAAGGVDLARRLGVDAGRHLDDAAAGNGDVLARPAVGQVGVADEQVEHHRSSLRNGLSSAAGGWALRDTTAMATMVSTNGSIRNTW